MSKPPEPVMHLGPAGIALRVAVLLALVVAATWASHMVRDALDLQITPSNEQQVHRVVILGSIAYVGLLALPFVPGAEIGLAMLTAFGASIAPLVYCATVLAMLLSYLVGLLLPVTVLVRMLTLFRLRKAADLVSRAARLPRQARVEVLLEGAPPRVVTLALRHRYVALALAVNTPGNAVIGGGGGIMLLAGLSGIFAPLPTALSIMIAVSPVPLAVALLGA
ncbi:hypothetical protein [Silicimonas sp. MF1-12-2]|uniref:hypothetical protein n=1 Tax=Silicimonas sp. MF1-12-2 TaxID=3384793 RepID=UPI0039B5BEE0